MARESGTQAMSSSWSQEMAIINGDVWFNEIIAAIDGAQRSVTLEIYMLENDGTGLAIIDALKRAGERGVDIRLIVDGSGSAGFVWNLAPELYQSRVTVRVFHPMPAQVLSPAFRHGSRVGNLLRLIPHINRRDHRKVCIIDEQAAFVGSFNLCDVIRPSLRGEEHWREAGARVAGAGLPELVQAFDHSWERSWRFHRRGLRPRRVWVRRRPSAAPTGLVRLNHRIAVRQRNWRDLLRRIDAARTRVWIAAAYFVPPPRLLRALSRAAKRGVEVHLLMSRRSDIAVMPWVAEFCWRDLLKDRVQVHLYEPGFVHAKVLFIDQWLCVGSSNLNMRSFLHDLEADVVLSSASSREKIEQAFTEGFAKSTLACRDDAPIPLYQWLITRCVLLLRRFI